MTAVLLNRPKGVMLILSMFCIGELEGMDWSE